MNKGNRIMLNALLKKPKTPAQRLVKGGAELAVLAGTAGAVFAADRLFKNSIEKQPDENFPRDLPGKAGESARFEKCHNDGFMMGRLRWLPKLVTVLPAVNIGAAVLEILILTAKGGDRIVRFGMSLVIGGGLSNLYDRLHYGYVIDYLNIKKGALHKIVLNLGDIAIFAGSLLAVAGTFFADRKKK